MTPPDEYMPSQEYREFVKYRLDRIDKTLDEMKESLSDISVEVVGLKIRAGLWGAIAGGLPSLIGAMAFYFWKGHT